MSLVGLKTFSRVSFTSATVASGVQLMSTRPALAHADHNMDKPSEPLEQTEQNPAQPESATAESNAQEALPGQMHSEMEEAMPSMEDHHVSEDTVLEVPATQETAPVVKAGISNNGFSFGLGESLLGLVIIGPVVLMAIKKHF